MLERPRLGALRSIQRRPGPGFLFLAEEVTRYRHSPESLVVPALRLVVRAFDSLPERLHVATSAVSASSQVLAMPISHWLLLDASGPGPPS